jgi:hypothetical protein
MATDGRFLATATHDEERHKAMSPTGARIAKSLLLSAVIALAVALGFYLFVRAHQELEIQPARWWQIGIVAFVVSAIFSFIYFRMRAER